MQLARHLLIIAQMYHKNYAIFSLTDFRELLMRKTTFDFALVE